VAEVAAVDAAMRTCSQLEVDLLLLNTQLFSIDAGKAMSKLRKRNPPLRVLCYSGRGGEGEIIPLLKCGVDGFIGHTSDRAEFLEAIRRICRGDSYFCPFASHLLADLATGKYDDGRGNLGLSERETQILRLIAAGRTSKEIAVLLGLSVKTVDTHRRNLMAKTEAHNAADLVRFGYSHDLLALALSET
jgi:two-component system nitrate/nitrite response regulator NarL